MCSAERLQGQPKSEGIFESTRTYVQGYRFFCIGQEATQQPPGHSVPSSLLTPSWSFGTVRALRLLSDSASSWQCSTLLDTWYNFPCSGALAVRHLAPSSSRDPHPHSWLLGFVIALSKQLLPRCLRSASLLGALLTTRQLQPPRCSMLFDLFVTLLASGNSPSSFLAAGL